MTAARSIFARTTLLAIATPVLCPAQPQFEAASIKPSPTPPAFRYDIDDHRIDFGGISLKSLVVLAFGMQGWQVAVPDWAQSTRVDIQATLPPGMTRAQVPQLLQTLLADRFGLAVHHEPQEHQIFALVQSKAGAKLTDAAADNNDRTFVTGRSVLYKIDSDEADGSYSISGKDGHFVLDAERITMARLAAMLTDLRYFDDPVVDMTGLKGYWQLRLDVPKPQRPGGLREARPQTGPTVTPDDPEGVSIEGELRKLGLDIEHRKAPVDTLVVDHLERQPTEN